MKKLLLLLLFLTNLTPEKTSAQITFQKTYGTTNNEIMGALIKTADKGYIMAGTVVNTATSQYNISVVKTDSNGTLQWTKIYGTINLDGTADINTTTDGGYIITGYTQDSNVIVKAMLLKIKADGTIQWVKSYGRFGENGTHVQQTADKGYIVIGGTSSVSSSGNVYVFKTDSLGALQWTKTFSGDGSGGYNSDNGASIMQTSDGNYVLLASIYSYLDRASHIYIAKINAVTDTMQWEHSFLIIPYVSYVTSFTQTADKGFIITGSASTVGNNSLNAFLFKTDSVGAFQWCKKYLGIGVSVIQTTDGGYAFLGGLAKSNYICKTDSSGTIQWTQAFGDTSNGHTTSVQTLLQNSNGQYIIGANTNSFGAGQNDFYLVKTNNLGKSNCNDYTLSIITTTATVMNSYSPRKDTTGTASAVIFTIDTGGVENTLCYNIGGISTYNTQNSTIKIYPNPANNKITIDATDVIDVKLFDVLGKQVTSTKTNDVDISNLTNGVYFIQVQTNKNIFTQKIIVQH